MTNGEDSQSVIRRLGIPSEIGNQIKSQVVGDFNNDGLTDFAYIVDLPQIGLKSYVYYNQPLRTILDFSIRDPIFAVKYFRSVITKKVAQKIYPKMHFHGILQKIFCKKVLF